MNLQEYYANCFPNEVFDFFASRSLRNYQDREFSLLWNNSTETTQRYNTYHSASELKTDLCNRQPNAISIGAVYATSPRYRSIVGKEQLLPVEKELVFDVDLKDYDDVRNCPCVGQKKCCDRCWIIAFVSAVVLKFLLEWKFFFSHFMCTFSGSKGYHLWVLDEETMEFTDKMRQNIVEYLHPFDQDYNLLPYSCSVMDFCFENIAEPLFREFILNGILNIKLQQGRELVRKIVHRYSEKEFDPFLSCAYMDDNNTVWEKCKHEIERNCAHSKHILHSIVFKFVFPRLDTGVTTRMAATLRLPFSVHQVTKKICLPIEIETMKDFRPSEAPTVAGAFQVIGSSVEFFKSVTQHPSKKLYICSECYTKIPGDVMAEEEIVQHKKNNPEHKVQTVWKSISGEASLLKRNKAYFEMRALIRTPLV